MKMLPIKYIYSEIYKNIDDFIPTVTQGVWSESIAGGAAFELVWLDKNDLLKKRVSGPSKIIFLYDNKKITNKIYEYWPKVMSITYYISREIPKYIIYYNHYSEITQRKYYDMNGNEVAEEEIK